MMGEGQKKSLHFENVGVEEGVVPYRASVQGVQGQKSR